jgi:hypothetical protein
MRYALVYVKWIFLLQSIKDNKKKETHMKLSE